MKSGKKNRDLQAFREAMADVTPLRRPDRIDPAPRRTPARAGQLEKDNREALKELLSQDGDHELETGEELLYLRPGYQSRVLRRLRRGHFSIADTVDLHHMDVATARGVLADFIERSVQRRMGCVRVIHGKGLRSPGRPRLKAMANHLLRRHPKVIAFASCRAVDGGTGATCVLLSARAGAAR